MCRWSGVPDRSVLGAVGAPTDYCIRFAHVYNSRPMCGLDWSGKTHWPKCLINEHRAPVALANLPSSLVERCVRLDARLVRAVTAATPWSTLLVIVARLLAVVVTRAATLATPVMVLSTLINVPLVLSIYVMFLLVR